MFLKRLLTICIKKIFVIYGLLPRIFVLRRESSKKTSTVYELYYYCLRIVSSSLLYSEGNVIFFLLVCMVVFLVGFCVCLFICAYIVFLSFCFRCITDCYIITFSRGLLNAHLIYFDDGDPPNITYFGFGFRLRL